MGKISTTPLIETPQGSDKLPMGRPGSTSALGARTVSLDQVKGYVLGGATATDPDAVHKTGDETISGRKRFGLAPLMPTDVCFWMDGQSGRPTYSAWAADQANIDSTAAFQAALDAAGSHTNPPMWFWQNQNHAKAQGIVTMAAATFKVSAPLNVPPGVFIEMNNATVVHTGVGDALRFEYNIGAYGWGNYFCGARNGFIVGPGSGTSEGSGVFCQVVNNGHFENLTIKGFKFGLQGQEVQYSTFKDIGCQYNQVGIYLTAQPSHTELTSIDNLFLNCVATYNTKYGLWLQCSTVSEFIKMDCQKNGVVDVVIGAQLAGYIPSYTVTSGGSGYAPSATIPAVISDSTGVTAQAYAVTDAGGVVTAVHSIDAGTGYTSPTVTVPGGVVAAAVTATVADESGLGAWDGHSSTNRGKNVFRGLKSEHGAGERPASGYAIIINDNAQRHNVFYDLVVQREGQTGGTPQYFRWMRSNGYGTTVVNPADPSTYPSALSNPAAPEDSSIFRVMDYQCLSVTWPIFMNPPAVGSYVVDWNNTPVAQYGIVSADAAKVGTSLTPAPGFAARSVTAATAGAPDQNSPALTFTARTWYGSQDNDTMWGVFAKSVSAGSRADLVFMYKNGAGAVAQNPLVLGGDGSVNLNKATGGNNFSAAMNVATTTAATGPATSGWSPAYQFLGRGWSSVAGASQAMTAALLVKPEGGTTNPVGVLALCYGTNATNASTANELIRFEWGDRLGTSFNKLGLPNYQVRVTGTVALNGMTITNGAAAPVTGTWAVGDRCFNSTPAVGQPKGWICTVSGTPGTWVSEGNL